MQIGSMDYAEHSPCALTTGSVSRKSLFQVGKEMRAMRYAPPAWLYNRTRQSRLCREGGLTYLPPTFLGSPEVFGALPPLCSICSIFAAVPLAHMFTGSLPS